MKRVIGLCLAIVLCGHGVAFGKSAFSPRHSGLEPPGEPRQSEIMPGRSPSRTPMGGMGYTDAYGNTLDDQPPPEKTVRKRLRPGANGLREQPSPPAALPDPDRADASPLWKFH